MEGLSNKIKELKNYNIYADNASAVKDRCESAAKNKNVWKRPLRWQSFRYIELKTVVKNFKTKYILPLTSEEK